MALIDSLIAYWKLDEASGNPADSSGNGYTLTNANVSFSAGKINNGASFGGSNSVLSSSNSVFNPAGDFSISLWLNYTSLAAYDAPCIISKDDIGNRGFTLNVDRTSKKPNIYIFKTGGGASTVITTNALTNSGTWYHVVITYHYVADGTSRLRIYLNGSLEEEITNAVGPIYASSKDLLIGEQGYSGYPRWWNGLLDEIGYWTKELTVSEVTSLYNGGSGLAYPLTEAVTSAIKLVNSLAKASVKTVKGLAIASVKTMQGLA